MPNTQPSTEVDREALAKAACDAYWEYGPMDEDHSGNRFILPDPTTWDQVVNAVLAGLDHQGLVIVAREDLNRARAYMCRAKNSLNREVAERLKAALAQPREPEVAP